MFAGHSCAFGHCAVLIDQSQEIHTYICQFRPIFFFSYLLRARSSKSVARDNNRKMHLDQNDASRIIIFD